MVSIFLLAVLSICMVLGCDGSTECFFETTGSGPYLRVQKSGYTNYYMNGLRIAKIPNNCKGNSVLRFDVCASACIASPSPHHYLLVEMHLVDEKIMSDPSVESRSESGLTSDLYSFAKSRGLFHKKSDGSDSSVFSITVRDFMTEFWPYMHRIYSKEAIRRARPPPVSLTTIPGQDNKRSSCVIS